MSFDYAESAQDALDILADFSATACTVTAAPPAPDVDDYDPSTGTGGELPPVVTVALGVILDYPVRAANYGNQTDAAIRAGDRQVLLAALDVNGAQVLPEQLPIDATLLAPDGLRYTVADVKPLAPAGYPVLYELNVRR